MAPGAFDELRRTSVSNALSATFASTAVGTESAGWWNGKLTTMHRFLVLDWLMELSNNFRLHRQTYHMAVSMIDRMVMGSPGITKKELQLLSIACLYVASKVEEPLPPPMPDFLIAAPAGTDKHDIVAVELQVMQALAWTPSRATVFQWVGTLVHAVCCMAVDACIPPEQRTGAAARAHDAAVCVNPCQHDSVAAGVLQVLSHGHADQLRFRGNVIVGVAPSSCERAGVALTAMPSPTSSTAAAPDSQGSDTVWASTQPAPAALCLTAAQLHTPVRSGATRFMLAAFLVMDIAVGHADHLRGPWRTGELAAAIVLHVAGSVIEKPIAALVQYALDVVPGTPDGDAAWARIQRAAAWVASVEQGAPNYNALFLQKMALDETPKSDHCLLQPHSKTLSDHIKLALSMGTSAVHGQRPPNDEPAVTDVCDAATRAARHSRSYAIHKPEATTPSEHPRPCSALTPSTPGPIATAVRVTSPPTQRKPAVQTHITDLFRPVPGVKRSRES